MAATSTFMTSLLTFFWLFSVVFSIAKASVPSSKTFKLVNTGEFGPYANEYDADYRVLSVSNSPFQLCFYNTTPNAFTLALRMGIRKTEPVYRWVWEANRGKPVRENAILSLGTDGNLVLVDPDGTIAWQTNTANKGVVGFELLPNGNMVLRDSKGVFIWQSFDYPTDTLLVGQALRVGFTTKLVSRRSSKESADGHYTVALEPKRVAFYFKSSTSPRPVVYFSAPTTIPQVSMQNLTFTSAPESEEGFAYELTLANNQVGILATRLKYNSTASFLRLGMDGNLAIYTYYDKVFFGGFEKTFSFFATDSSEPGCQLPERCGQFGVCEENQCVACPSERGLLGWSKSCAAKKVTSCATKDFHYYKVEGLRHYMSKYSSGIGPMKVDDCGKKCTSDCKCLGYFYNQETSRCWIAYDLLTLTKVPDTLGGNALLGFIKVPNK